MDAMTSKLRKLIELRSCEFWISPGIPPFPPHDEVVINPDCAKPHHIHVVESSHCEALMSALRVCVDVIEMQQKSMRASIARSDDYGDSHCSAPIREAIKQATDKLMESIE